MLAVMSQQAPIMSFPAPQQSSPKRPRLSLKIQPSSSPSLGKPATALKTDIDTTSPTAFNTLSNAYASAIENASPKSTKPPPSALSGGHLKPTSLRLVTNASSQEPILFPSQRTQTPGPFTVVYPDTPTTSYTSSTPISRAMEHPTFTFTPPTSAHPENPPKNPVFSFTSAPIPGSPASPRTPGRRRATIGSQAKTLPYTHPLSLHSILRNSPLASNRTSQSMPSSSRSSSRLAEKASKRVGYNNPLTQTITTEKYIHSHIDLLLDNTSPYPQESDSTPVPLDTTMAYTGDETRDGGQTPGPFEEMRRRMAGLDADAEAADEGDRTPGGGARKRKREKNRRWVWTIGVNEEEDSPIFPPISGIAVSDGSAAPDVKVPLLKAIAYSPRVVEVNDEQNATVIEEPREEPRSSIVVPTIQAPSRTRPVRRILVGTSQLEPQIPIMPELKQFVGEDSEMSGIDIPERCQSV